MLTEKEITYIRAMCKHNMITSKAAGECGTRSNAFAGTLDTIRNKTGLDGRQFEDLARLARMADEQDKDSELNTELDYYAAALLDCSIKTWLLRNNYLTDEDIQTIGLLCKYRTDIDLMAKEMARHPDSVKSRIERLGNRFPHLDLFEYEDLIILAKEALRIKTGRINAIKRVYTER